MSESREMEKSMLPAGIFNCRQQKDVFCVLEHTGLGTGGWPLGGS